MLVQMMNSFLRADVAKKINKITLGFGTEYTESEYRTSTVLYVAIAKLLVTLRRAVLGQCRCLQYRY